MKANAKDKKACTQRYNKGTGGGPKGKSSTEMEERIVSLIGDVVCTGIPGVQEMGGGCSSATIVEEQHQLNEETIVDDVQEVI